MNSVGFTSRLKELGLPVVTVATASSILQKSPAYARLYIRRLRMAGALKLVEWGKYCLPGTDDYTIASRIISNSYITGYAALEHYRLTTQLALKLQVVSMKYHRPLRLSEHTAEFVKVKREFIYGFVATWNGPAFAEPEKIFIDDLYLHGRQYYSEEFEYALNANKIDVEKLNLYAEMSGNKTLMARIRALVDYAAAPKERAKVVSRRMDT